MTFLAETVPYDPVGSPSGPGVTPTPESKSKTATAHTHRAKSRFICILFQTGDGTHSDINYSVTRRLRQLMDSKITSGRQDTEIDLWLESPGGNAHAAYKLALALRARTELLRVIVPDYAKSAATLLALAADEIYMDRAAELGPLDAQVTHPERQDDWVSALDIAETIEQLTKIGQSLAIYGGGQVFRITGLRRADALNSMQSFTSNFIAPVVGKLDPVLIHRASNELQVAERYGKRLLRVQIERFPARKSLLQDLPRKLVKDYPAHGYVIDLEEAQELGLNAFEPQSYDLWETANRLCEQFEARGKEPLIEFMSETELRSQMKIGESNGS